MNASGIHFVARFLLVVSFGVFAASCSTKATGNGATIYKVNPYELTDVTVSQPAITDVSVAFERRHHLHGAISTLEQREREGNYYSIFWKADDRSQPLTVRFEYRQPATGLLVKTLEQEVTRVKRRNVTHFSLTGADYNVNGPVTSWRASILRGKEVLVSYESYLWK